MAKEYGKASDDVLNRIEKLRKKHYVDLESVTIQALFVFDQTNEQCLSHQGYPAAAVTKIVSVKERAAGLADVMIVVDRFYYSSLVGDECNALLDHELYHIERVIDEKTGRPAHDVIDRPKLRLRKHDRAFGWFDEIAARHGHASVEVRQAQDLLSSARQLYFDFAGGVAA